MSKVCDSYTQLSFANTSATMVTEGILLLIWTPFAVHFLFKLRSLPEQNTMIWSVVIYVISVFTLVLIRFWIFCFESIVQTHVGYNAGSCAFQELVMKLSSIFSYIALLEVYICRLSLVFDGSQYSINPWLIRLCHSLNILTGLVVFSTLVAGSTHIGCYARHKSGITHSMGLSRTWFRTCNLPSDGPTTLAYVIYSMLLIIMNGFIAWKFISNLRRLMKDSDSLDPSEAIENQGFRILAGKSTVTFVASMVTFLMALLINQFFDFASAFSMDVCLNLVFLYCIFVFGDDLYHTLFGQWINRWIRNDSEIKLPRPVLVLSRSRTASMKPQ